MPRVKSAPALLPFRPEALHRSQPGRLLRANVQRRRGDRGVPQVLLRDLNRHPAGQRVAGVGVTQPVARIEELLPHRWRPSVTA